MGSENYRENDRSYPTEWNMTRLSIVSTAHWSLNLNLGDLSAPPCISLIDKNYSFELIEVEEIHFKKINI